MIFGVNMGKYIFNIINNKSVLAVTGLLLFTIIIFGELVYLYEKRHKIFAKFSTKPKIDTNENDSEIAKLLLKGGYILHFRHAERDKWIDVAMYDALESDVHGNGINSTRFAENDYFKNAVCLNERGEIQARAMGEYIQNIGLPIGFVISSPSCRSRQTAELAFGGYDKLDRTLVHRGPYNETVDNHLKDLKKLYLDLPIEEGFNTIVSGHNGTLNRRMFDSIASNIELPLFAEEGGFYVIKKVNGKLMLEYEFHNFLNFSRVFHPR